MDKKRAIVQRNCRHSRLVWYRSTSFKVPKKAERKKDEVEEGFQAFSQMNKGIQKTVVMKKRTRSEGNVEDESPKKKVKKKHRMRH